MPETITPGLIEIIRGGYALDWNGIHGISHWRRVRENGVRLAAVTGATVAVVELFAFLHDSKRLNDGIDPLHGAHAADFARSLCGSAFLLAPEDLEILASACRDHTSGSTHADVTVRTCWDADRLDLGRIGTVPDPAFLCTEAAREPSVIAWAYERSRRRRMS